MVRANIDLEKAKAALLLQLYEDAINNRICSDSDYKSLGQGVGLRQDLTKIAANELKNAGYCDIQINARQRPSPLSPNSIIYSYQNAVYDETIFVGITQSGIKHVQEWEDSYFDEIKKLVGSHLSIPVSGDDALPASDRFVKLDHNSEPYREAVAAIDNVIEEVRGDNEYGSRDPDDKSQRIAELKAGKKLLEAPRAAYRALSNLLLETLNYLSGIGVAIGRIADAIAKIKTLFDIL